MTRPRHIDGRRRGIAIGAVLLVGLGVLLIVVGTLHFVRAGVASMGGIDTAIQTRLAARSAVRVLAAELYSEREAMLAGSPPSPPDRYELFELPGGEEGRIAVARLLPLGPGGASDSYRIYADATCAEGPQVSDWGVYCYDFLSLPVAPCRFLLLPVASYCFLLSPARV